MKTHATRNRLNTLRATVFGREVHYYRRTYSAERYRSPAAFWHATYDCHEHAVHAAEHFAETGKLLFPCDLRKPPTMPLFEARV
jgi:hypothetical protein